MKYKLEIYYDKELTQFNTDFDLTLINNKNFFHKIFFDNEGWKIKSNKFMSATSNSLEMIQFGEFIINLVEGYKRKEFFYDLTSMQNMSIPDFFDYKIFTNIILSKNYEFLINYLDLILGIFEEKMMSDLNIMLCLPFYKLLNNFQRYTINYIKYPLFYNKELDHHLNKEYLDELRSFGYFNIKWGECDYIGNWKIQNE
jgi:hypothetical protein